jgi:hypothetical protein
MNFVTFTWMHFPEKKINNLFYISIRVPASCLVVCKGLALFFLCTGGKTTCRLRVVEADAFFACTGNSSAESKEHLYGHFILLNLYWLMWNKSPCCSHAKFLRGLHNLVRHELECPSNAPSIFLCLLMHTLVKFRCQKTIFICSARYDADAGPRSRTQCCLSVKC